MTYQDILVEFNKLRDADMTLDSPITDLINRTHNLEWAIQSILEKLRDQENVSK
jgi:hypothetical protein